MKDNADKQELERLDFYYDICLKEHEITRWRREQLKAVEQKHLNMWNCRTPQIKNADDAHKAWALLNMAHTFLAGIYCFDITYPANDPRHGQIKEHVDLRPPEWLKDLANEEKILKELKAKSAAKV